MTVSWDIKQMSTGFGRICEGKICTYKICIPRLLAEISMLLIGLSKNAFFVKSLFLVSGHTERQRKNLMGNELKCLTAKMLQNDI